MKVGETRPLAGVREVAKRTGRRTESSAPVHEVTDTASVMGIPEHELTANVRQAIMTLMAEVERLRQELKQTQARAAHLEQLADEDSLLPVYNRRAFVRELSRAMSYSERYGTPASVLYYDVNDLKRINDAHGHGAGDAVLSRVADVLLKSVRDTDIVGRLGGDEFGVILAQADQTVASEKAAGLAAEIQSQTIERNGEKIPIRVSYGAYEIKSGEDVDNVLDAADRAMYAHKNGSRRANG